MSLSLFPSQLESLLQLWLTLSLNTCTGAGEESGSDIFLFNASRVPTIPLNQGQLSTSAILSLCFSVAPFKLQDYHSVVFWLTFECAFIRLSAFSIHQQFSDSVGLVPQHLPEDLVSGVALSCLDDQHAAYWSVPATDFCVDLQQ